MRKNKIFNLILLCVLTSFFFQGCNKSELGGKAETYDGPLYDFKNIDLLYSDSAKVKVHMISPRELVMPNQDMIFPDGIHLDFYDATGQKETQLTSKKARYRADKQTYVVTDSVVVLNFKKQETLLTEELNWLQSEKKIHTNKEVTIKTPTELLKGEGLDAKQDFSWYRIRKPTGIFPIDTKE